MVEFLKLERSMRLDSIPIDKTYYTEEGYLVDQPIVTTTGIFEYRKPDGTVRRELRLPEHVFDPESLASYEGKPIIITHKAGAVDKDNVDQYHVGTILSKGYQDGENVRAKIIIHDTDAMKDADLKELSLGYNLESIETPGVWNGQPYDAIQTNIRVNHLAIVKKARAGDQARLNIDSDDDEILKGEVTMAETNGITPEQLSEAVEKFKARKDARLDAKEKGDEGETKADPKDTAVENPDSAGECKNTDGDGDPCKKVRERRDRRDSDGTPKNLDEAMKVISQQDEDIDALLGMIDALKEGTKKDSEDITKEPPANEDGDESKSGAMNADSVDALVRERVKLARIGDQLNIDGLDAMGIMDAKKSIISKVKPGMRLDGKSESYINAAFDMSMAEVNSRKDTNYQRKQMFNADSAKAPATITSSASESRKRMIEKMTKNGGIK